MKIKVGNYIKSSKMGVEGVLTWSELLTNCPTAHNPILLHRIKLFCTRDKTYPPNVGKTIIIRIDTQFWEVVSAV